MIAKETGSRSFVLRGDWINAQGRIDSSNRPRRVRFERAADGTCFIVDQYGRHRAAAYAVGDDCSLMIEVPGPGANLINVLCMGGFAPDAGELERVGLEVIAL